MEVKVNSVYAAFQHAVEESGQPRVVLRVKFGLLATPVLLFMCQMPVLEFLECADKEGARATGRIKNAQLEHIRLSFACLELFAQGCPYKMVNQKFRRVINAALLALVYFLLKACPFCGLLQLVRKVVFIGVPKDIGGNGFESVAQFCFWIDIKRFKDWDKILILD